MKRLLVRRDSYYDSVFLMLINQEVKQAPGVRDAVVAMGTPMNRDLLRDMGLATPESDGATPNDLIIAVVADEEAAADAAVEAAQELLTRKSGGGPDAAFRPATLQGAIEQLPDSNLVIVSLPGAFAPREVRRALLADRHVMLFSDNVSLEDEVALKRLARERGLLMMGPDCGTAIINGKPLCFANVVRRGSIGLVAASGTGLQEATCAIDARGGGVSQAIGTGGRDLRSEEVGGAMMLSGIAALAADPATDVIAILSKPPHPAVAEVVLEALRAAGKPAVVHLIGMDAQNRGDASTGGTVHFAANLEELAGMAVALAEGRPYTASTFTAPPTEIEAIVTRETAAMSATQRNLRGFYTGGTLADEALFLLTPELGGIYSFDPADPAFKLADPHASVGHTIVDLGEDVFTVGRPHPMIDPSTRTERLEREIDDAETAVWLLDCVLGYGSHPDPAGAMAPVIAAARRRAADRGGNLAVIASITGTPGDPQNRAVQQQTLEAAGATVMPSNYQAAMLALEMMRRIGKGGAK